MTEQQIAIGRAIIDLYGAVTGEVTTLDIIEVLRKMQGLSLIALEIRLTMVIAAVHRLDDESPKNQG